MAQIATKYIDSYNWLELLAEETNKKPADNKSSVKVTLKLHVVGSVSSANVRVNVTGGSESNLGYKSWGAGTYTLKEATSEYTHNSDGSKTVSVSGYFNSSIGNWNLSGNITLTKFDVRATITSAYDFNDDENPTITYYNPSGNNVSSLQARIENEAATVAYLQYRDISKTGTSYTFNFTDAERKTLRDASPDGKTLRIRYVVRTIINGTQYWSVSVNTMTIVNKPMWLRVNGEYIKSYPHVRINGEWKKAKPYIRVNGEWKEEI